MSEEGLVCRLDSQIQSLAGYSKASKGKLGGWRWDCGEVRQYIPLQRPDVSASLHEFTVVLHALSILKYSSTGVEMEIRLGLETARLHHRRESNPLLTQHLSHHCP